MNRMDKFLDKAHACGLLDASIKKAERELEELRNKKAYFEREFAVYFSEVKV